MLPFIVLLILGVIENDCLAIAALLAIPLGFFQILFGFTTLYLWNEMNRYLKISQIIYLATVLCYFLIIFFTVVYEKEKEILIMKYILYTIPIILALFITLFIEKLKSILAK
ncbi:hypothetical protein KUL156_31620 [Alteromonas sp. KUL156]|nr:hypothetical protein KUL154_08480 [Alteromonas sp. KUL154]GFE00570.1 hypothetical protein KUL156_31620 [Alteromonas sp. KUL156]